LIEINKKLLRVGPIAEEAKSPGKGLPSGWFEEILDKLTCLRAKIQTTRLEESQRLKRAVAAGEVKRVE